MMAPPAAIDDAKAIMEEMTAGNALDDPDYILQNLTLISAVRPEEQPAYNKVKDAHKVVQSQVRRGCAARRTRARARVERARVARGQVSYLCACALEGIIAALWAAENESAKPSNGAAAAAAGHPIVGVLGCGQLGASVLRTLIDCGWSPSSLALCARNETTAVAQFRALGIATTPSLNVLAARVRVLVLAVGPAHFETLATPLAKCLPADVLVVSCIAGVPLAKVRSALHAQHVVRTQLEPSVLTVKWDVKMGAVEGDNSEAVVYEKRGLKRSVKPSLFGMGGGRGFSMTDAASHLREARTPSTAKDVLEAAATHYVQETDDILHTFASFERYYIYGLGLSKRSARRSARRAVLGVESSQTTPAGNPAISDVLKNSSASLLLHAKAEQRAADEEERLKALEDGSGEEPVPEDAAAGPEPAEGLANVLVQLEHHLLPCFHRVVAKQLKLSSIPPEDPFEKKKAPPEEIVPKVSAAPAKVVGSALEGGDEDGRGEFDLAGGGGARPAKTPLAPAL